VVNDVLIAARARDNSFVGRRNGKGAVKVQHDELLDLLTRAKQMRDLLTLKSFELAAMYARVAARDGHAYATSIARISLKCDLTETEARRWITLGEAMLNAVRKPE
jgi:hypothetical protein